MKKINLNGIIVNLDRRDIKNLNIYIKPPNGQVLVTIPRRMSEEKALEYVKSRLEWIQGAQKKVISREESQAFSAFPSQEEIEKMKERIPKLAEKWEPLMKVHGNQWQLRDMKTRWGSVNVKTGNIHLNLRLAGRPEECLEYVLVHELCHLLEPSHNARFHSLMDGFLPDWRQRKRKLEGLDA